VNEEQTDQNNKFIENKPEGKECPHCRMKTTILLDPKQISDKKSMNLCLVCGQVFEYINPTN
jgi:CRISPR/Cas system-associated protein Cas10 (large subunit of type III CRISPR-Cas system)